MFLISCFKVIGHSMEPTFYSGETILVSIIPYWFKNPKIRDIIVFKNADKKYIIKRIAEIKGKQYIVKGDNLKDSKEFDPVFKEEILGKVILVI